jgi:hypothetical protein
MEESDVMIWLSENHSRARVVCRALPRHRQVAIADMLMSLARASLDDADWHQLISRYLTMH